MRPTSVVPWKIPSDGAERRGLTGRGAGAAPCGGVVCCAMAAAGVVHRSAVATSHRLFDDKRLVALDMTAIW